MTRATHIPKFFSILAGGLLAIGGLKAADGTTDRQAAEAKFLETRTQTVLQMDGDFFREEEFTPEQIQRFITTRLAAEESVTTNLRQVDGAVFLPSMLATQMDTSLAKSFSPEIAQRYRAWDEMRLGWQIIRDNPILKANEWLTLEEQTKLARAWGPICFAAMDVTFNPKFNNATRKEKHALLEQLSQDYLKSAIGVLDAPKLAELKKRLNEIRSASLKEIDAGVE